MWCSAFSFAVPLVAEPIPCLNFQKLSKSRDGLQKSDLKSTYQLFSRSGFHLNPKEFSPWTSFMARDLPLGPSVAPWPVETSTAHGNSSFWAMVFLSGIVKSLWLTLSALDNALSWVSSLMLPPETRYSPQPSLPSPVSRRRMHFSLRSTKTKLGFLLEVLKLIAGPLTLLRPKPICYNPNLQSIKISWDSHQLSHAARSSKVWLTSTLRFASALLLGLTFSVSTLTFLYLLAFFSTFVTEGFRLASNVLERYDISSYPYYSCAQCSL